MAKLKTDQKGLALQPGDIIDVQHTSKPDSTAMEFRVEEVNQNPYDHIEIIGSEYSDVFV